MKPQEIFEHYTAMMDDMLQAHDFWKIYFQAPLPLYNEQEIPFPLFSGATRSCLVDINYPYVVKWDTIESGEECGCEREAALYDAAVNEELDQYFLEPICLGYYERTVVAYDASDFYDERNYNEKYYPNEKEYAEAITCLESEGLWPTRHTIRLKLWAYPRAISAQGLLRKQHSDEAKKAASSYPRYGRNLDMPSIAAWVDEIGVAEFAHLYEFLLDNDINDLHSGNIMQYNSHLVFSDYAGVI